MAAHAEKLNASCGWVTAPAAVPLLHGVVVNTWKGAAMLFEISLGSATSNQITGTTTPEAVIADIIAGRWADKVKAVRLADGQERDRLKKELPAVLWSGTFSHRANKGLIQSSGLICADLDKMPDRLAELHDMARNDPHVVAAFVSPSGNGLKIVFRADDFPTVRAHVSGHYGAQVDEAAKDVARLCFVSHDPAAFYNPDAAPLPKYVEPSAVARVEPCNAAPTSSRAEIAEKLLGPIDWSDSNAGFCQCPGEHLHTTANGQKDCKVMLSGVPTISCFHNSCSGIVAGVNREMRSQIGKNETAGSLAGLKAPNDGDSKNRVLTLRSPDELLAMQFDDSDIILGDRLLAKGQPLVIAAQGGTGKSRLALQIVAAIVTGRKCLSFDTGCREMRWLILQTENSNRRLQQDLARIKTWLSDDWQHFAERVVFHTVENDDDGFVSLDSPENQLAIQRAIESAAPDGIVIDPLNDFAAGDLNKDADMKNTLQMISRLCRRGNPQRAIVVLHHSLTGKAGASRVTGHDRTSFARNSKALHAWTRGQINLAPVDPEDNQRLIVGCGKCSNGREFLPFAVRLNAQTMIYECDSSVDVAAWQSEMSAKPATADLSPDMVAGIVAELGKASGAPKKTQIVRALQDETGCAKGSAYRAVERAESAKKIHYTKATKTYVAR